MGLPLWKSCTTPIETGAASPICGLFVEVCGHNSTHS